MATLMTVICDLHDKRGQQVEANAGTVPIKFNSKMEMEADLCTDCVEEYTKVLEPLMEIARRSGKPLQPQLRHPGGARPAARSADGAPSTYKREQPDLSNGRFACRWPDGACVYQTEGLPTAVGRGIHESRAHKFNLKKVQQEERAKARKAAAKKQPAHA